MENKKKARVIAFYLPQFHPIPENDEWWGKGFTEWTNVGKAKPLFKNHYQPRVPADLGYYDLRLSEIRESQAQMAQEAGIEGFCYWHYWFGNGKRLLETPFNEVLNSGKPDFPFCLGWANHSWTNKTWNLDSNKPKEKILIEQQYNDFIDYELHFNQILPALQDKRYIKIDNKPIFVVYRPKDIPKTKEFIDLWNKLAIENGLNGIYFIGISSNTTKNNFNLRNPKEISIASTNNCINIYNEILNLGFDAVNSRGIIRAEMLTKGKYNRLIFNYLQKFFNNKMAIVYKYEDIIKNIYTVEDRIENIYPTILPQWDRSPRSGTTAGIYHDSSPEKFKKHVINALELIKDKKDEHKILFLQSWNEWAEGNYIEPDLRFGKGYINVLKEVLINN